jgi:TonB family protein
MRREWFLICLAISLLMHVSTFISLNFLQTPKKPDSNEIEVTILDEPPKDPANLPKPQQIVDQSEKSVNDEIPKDAKYLSRNNQTVAKETVAQAKGAFANRDNGAPQPQQNPVKQQQASTEKSDSPDKDISPDGLKNKKPKLKDLVPKYTWAAESSSSNQGQGVSTSDDFLKEKAKGAETLLNTREFVYYSYYSRIKDRLRQYWEPKIKQKISRMLNQGRKLASEQNHITKMIITLDSEGTLVRVQVISESGVRDLDEAAIEAFQAAAPFPNPPKGIVAPDGTIKIRWDFVLEARNGDDLQKRFFAERDANRRPRRYY